MELVGSAAAPVEVDPERLAQIVANLVENALKHAATRVRASVEIENGTLIVLVDDDGPGIAEGERSRVFDRLYTARGTPTRKVGTGIGLAVVRELTHAMGGLVSCEPRELDGTRFVVRIPATPAVGLEAPRRPTAD